MARFGAKRQKASEIRFEASVLGHFRAKMGRLGGVKMRLRCSQRGVLKQNLPHKSALQVLLGRGVVSESVVSADIFYITEYTIENFYIYTINIHI
jgi:hypothetical protein